MRRTETRDVGSVIAEYIAEDGMSDGLRKQRIFEAWDLVVGSPSITLRKSFNDGTLVCRISSSVIRTQMSFNLESYRRQLNSLLQEEAVGKIILL